MSLTALREHLADALLGYRKSQSINSSAFTDIRKHLPEVPQSDGYPSLIRQAATSGSFPILRTGTAESLRTFDSPISL
jgi:hypothetical protein